MKNSKILSASDSPGLKTTKRAGSHARKVFGNFHTGNIKDYFPPKRPLLVVAIAYLVLSILYVNLFYVFPKLNITDKGQVTIQGKVSDISLNSDGSIASFVLKGVYKEKRIGINKGSDVLCYVNRGEIYASHYKSQDMDSVSSYVNMGPDDISPVFPGGIYEVSGKIRLYSNATNPGEFDIKRYYESHHVIYSITLSSVKCLRPAPGLLETFFKLRCFFLRQIRLNCPLEYGTINTILWADKSALQKDRKDRYQSVGLAHFLVISGLHIQILGTALYYLLKNLSIPRSICALTSMALILLYSLLVGFHVSVFRAIVMFSLRLLGDILKRPYDMLSALGLSTFLALIIDPFSILDNGFIYSYLCVLALSIYMEILSKNSKKYMVAVTVWLYLLPVNLFTNYKVSLISIFLNLVLGVFTGPLMIIGCFCFVFSLHNFIIPAAICDFLFALLIRFMDKVCDIFNHFSALTILGKPNAIALFIYYLILLTFHILGQKKASRFLENLLYLFLVLFISTNFSFAPFMTMLDVGQGQCIVVCYAPKKCIIYDIGSSSKNDISKRIIFPFLQAKGIDTVTDLYLSHSDSDHTNALSDFISDSESEGIRVKNILISDAELLNPDGLSLPQMAKVKIKNISSGYEKDCGLRVKCLWPVSLCKPSNKVLNAERSEFEGFDLCKPIDSNYSSLVLLLSYKDTDIMLTGDITSEVEDKLLSSISEEKTKLTDQKIEILQVAHHGSKYSSSEDFLNLVGASHAFISVGLHNSYKHPSKETLERLKSHGYRVHRTDTDGALTYPLK